MCDIFITENFMQNWILKFNFLWCLNYLLSGSSPNIVITPGPIWILLRICLAAAKAYGVFFYVIPRICSLNLFCASLNSFPRAGKQCKTFLTAAVVWVFFVVPPRFGAVRFSLCSAWKRGHGCMGWTRVSRGLQHPRGWAAPVSPWA